MVPSQFRQVVPPGSSLTLTGLHSQRHKYGTRSYRDKGGDYHAAWEGDLGRSTFLDAVIRPVTAETSANSQRQKGYENCPACAQIDLLKAIPPSVTTFAPGAGFAVTAPAAAAPRPLPPPSSTVGR